ncbi:MAG: undecaprenyl diphosphate synthase family protein, partial [bacterium]|nr:undecaprenyl diphosphate synthase family protein [bacterium]
MFAMQQEIKTSPLTPGTLTREDVPKHVGIIIDGNRRWAKERGLPSGKGHEAGVETLKRAIKKAQAMGITNLTIYVLSTENLKRTKSELA